MAESSWADYVDRRVLSKSNSEYARVARKFHQSSATKKISLEIIQIEKVTNFNLLLKYEDKKDEYVKKYGSYREEVLFHGTRNKSIPSILKSNLLVERNGLNIGHRFGAGVSFSAWAHYASHYSDEPIGQMLLCLVLVSYIIEVPEVKHGPAPIRPYIEGRYPLRYDTTAKNEHLMDVIVKYENHSYYPAYVIHFEKTETSLSPMNARMFNLTNGRQQQREPMRVGRTPAYFVNESALRPDYGQSSQSVPNRGNSPNTSLDFASTITFLLVCFVVWAFLSSIKPSK